MMPGDHWAPNYWACAHQWVLEGVTRAWRCTSCHAGVGEAYTYRWALSNGVGVEAVRETLVRLQALQSGAVIV